MKYGGTVICCYFCVCDWCEYVLSWACVLLLFVVAYTEAFNKMRCALHHRGYHAVTSCIHIGSTWTRFGFAQFQTATISCWYAFKIECCVYGAKIEIVLALVFPLSLLLEWAIGIALLLLLLQTLFTLKLISSLNRQNDTLFICCTKQLIDNYRLMHSVNFFLDADTNKKGKMDFYLWRKLGRCGLRVSCYFERTPKSFFSSFVHPHIFHV